MFHVKHFPNVRKGGKMSTKEKINYYSLDKILKKNTQYKVIFGKRSNGKTYAVLDRALRRYFKDGTETAYIRRNREDLIGKNGQTLFNNHIQNGLIEKYSKGVWTDVYYYGKRWYFCRWEEDDKGHRQRITDEKPFCYGFVLSGYEHDKSTSYPNVGLICFDEFLSRTNYLPDEFVLFMNCISTIARLRTDVEIFMLGNTVNKYCPYFSEMGLKNVKNMQAGTIDVYKYGESDLRVAVEYTAPTTGATGKGNVLFAFNNPKLQMITHGDWEIDIYPHLPYRYKTDDILYTYFVEFDGETLQCEILRGGEDFETGKRIDAVITYIHLKSTEIRHPDKDVIFSPEMSPLKNHYTRLTHPIDKRTQKIVECFRRDKVFYQNNEVGEIMNNYLKWCD